LGGVALQASESVRVMIQVQVPPEVIIFPWIAGIIATIKESMDCTTEYNLPLAIYGVGVISKFYLARKNP